jgi:hypothetical protein
VLQHAVSLFHCLPSVIKSYLPAPCRLCSSHRGTATQSVDCANIISEANLKVKRYDTVYVMISWETAGSSWAFSKMQRLDRAQVILGLSTALKRRQEHPSIVSL